MAGLISVDSVNFLAEIGVDLVVCMNSGGRKQYSTTGSQPMMICRWKFRLFSAMMINCEKVCFFVEKLHILTSM
jgi:hypothetical protein